MVDPDNRSEKLRQRLADCFAGMNLKTRKLFERRQIQQLDVADRVLLCELYTAVERISQLEARRKEKGRMSDLLCRREIA